MEAHTVHGGLTLICSRGPRMAALPPAGCGLIREIGALLAASGGLVVVVIGVLAVMTMTGLDGERSGGAATVAAGAFTVLGTIIGAYFGVRVGHGKQEAEAARVASEAKVARLALHVDKQDAEAGARRPGRALGLRHPRRRSAPPRRGPPAAGSARARGTA